MLETGDIPPPTLPQAALLFSRNADGPAAGPEETSSSSWVRDGQHLGNLCSQPCFMSVKSHCLGFAPWKHFPSHAIPPGHITECHLRPLL